MLGLNYAPETTGIAPYTASFARGMAARGSRVRVVTTFPHYPQWRFDPLSPPWSTSETRDAVRVDRRRHYVPRRPTVGKRLLSEMSFGIRVLVSRWGRPDLLVLVSPAMFASGLALLRARLMNPKTTVITWVQDLYSLGVVETAQGGSVAARVVSAIESALLRNSDSVVVIHDRFADHVVNRLGVPRSQVDVVRNWTHLPEPTAVDRPSIRARFGWADDEIIALHAGNMGAKQGLENVILAARMADEKSLPIRFVLMGDGNRRDELVRASQGVRRLEFMKPVSDAQFQPLLASADVLLVNELPGVAGMAVPSKLTSYFSTGRPVVAATGTGSVTESEVRAAGGLTVPAADPKMLLEALMHVGQDRDLAQRIGAAGLQFRDQYLSEDGALDRYARLLARLVPRRAPSTTQAGSDALH
ncbi:glycosyltransferase [Curtobacterium sp. MCBD17_040]|uniref:glycosyltransferase n=1 Tax=Curtobacterium sp. MCBD17_040 TaxID=2175674 RepID=UPI0021ABA795|nr:glycosyltransferase [Curtobacterium sp. MCBD17_040]WIB65238.1 glycosyltransferase [Curtobacterium sp. MCBD17_040]